MTYEKIGPTHPQYKAMVKHHRLGYEFCDSLDHNDDNGCSNPSCWKYKLKCNICGKQMRSAQDKPFELDRDCGGDCWECVKDSESGWDESTH